ncbi:MAG: hypothetical protein HGB04_06875 [Chlorobiaceae bacterium]|nr:hypothetical protein [Chlorobiaceae bacterium]
MKALFPAALTIALLLAGSSPAMAARNFSNLSNDELAAVRGTLKDETAETREAFRNEWQKRISTMTSTERERMEKEAGITRPQSGEEDENAGCN